ncbi:rho GTPase-activating protein 11A isoform X2 [Rhineura floridana]|uniref:rho GTPase-activating protein 11A isoform X2 n=1 Tax=Rhineura floridana TaxID=261503 RepID=UPI002AC87CF1|nr:rho GTPase-activating protein 11A isoform X2 [Rhineura floridana]
MEIMESRGRGLAKLAVQQQLRAAYGIKMKNRTGKGKPAATAGVEGGKIFGIALHELPHQDVPEYGSIPCFLVEACKHLEEHIHTEGLFRKSGSFVRLKTLKGKLDQGENCLSTAQPCDVAGLVKQFFRELPEPILPSDLQEAFIKAQQLGIEEKNSATLLISCLMNDRTIHTLRYFFKFLKKVSLRSSENKMDSSNLAVIFAPNLLQSSEPDKISAHTEKKLRLQAAVLQTLIDHAEEIGHVPKFILEKIPTMLGVDGPVSTPSLQDYEESEGETPGEHTRRRRLSIGAFPSVTPVIVTPKFKRKYPADSCQGFSSKKRRSIRHNLALELLPSSLFSISSTPGSAQFETSPCVSLEASQSSVSTSVTSEKHPPSLGSRRSKRIASKKIHRAESGKMGCFSPKISRKEMVRRSLRLKFILGRSSKENTAMDHPPSNRSENIGRRLASQQNVESVVDNVKTVALLSPCIGESIKKDSKNISKSEENLQIRNQHNEARFRISWTGPRTTGSEETNNNATNLMACFKAETSSSEPALKARKPPVISVKSRPADASTGPESNKQTSFCEDENNLTTDTLLKIKKAFSESGSNLHKLNFEGSVSNKLTQGASFSELNLEGELSKAKVQKMSNVEQKTRFASSANKSNATDKHLPSMEQIKAVDASLFQNTTETNNPIHEFSISNGSIKEDQVTTVTSPGTHLNSTNTLKKETWESNERSVEEFKYCNSERDTKECLETGELLSQLPEDGERSSKRYLRMETQEKSQLSPSGKVADHIHWFNKLSLNEPHSGTKTKSPLKFQRTPVRQSIRRMNSLLEANKQSITCKIIKAGGDCPSLVKSVSYETALSACVESISNTSTASLSSSESVCRQMSTCDQFALSSKSYLQLIYPLQRASRPGETCRETLTTYPQSKSALEDLTNYEVPKTVKNTSINLLVSTPDKCLLRKTLTEKRACYKGSPKNPMATAKLVPVVKPLDL